MQDLCTMVHLCYCCFSDLLPLRELKDNLIIFCTDLVSAMLIRATGQNLQLAYLRTLGSLDLVKQIEGSEIHPSGDVAALIYLCNPFTIVACVGLSTSPIENMAVILCLYGACSRLIPLAAFGWVIATHLSLYPAILIIPVIFLLGRGPDAPPWKLFLQRHQQNGMLNQSKLPPGFSWGPIIRFAFWSLVWSVYVLVLCGISLKQFGGLWEMFKSTYGFILTVEDLSPNIGVLWYFFAEVFEFFRSFFLIVFHVNILFMILPLAIRLHHRPCYLAFVYVAIFSMLKSYPSVGDSALYLGLLGWFVNEFSDMQFSLFLFCGYVGVSLLSPVMHNLWIWRGTGNANFYFATAMVYACLQIVLVVEGVSAMLNHERKLRRLITGKTQDSKSGLLSDSSP
ncbi:phosphatidylinositol glycan anchor biosynthesis class U protein-like isoform X3 [Hibiscus syriacus]|uniref:phosphatidylinositol glycan anchor biosynthesis class U protein-like isoform X3 n=1 Tax=Hibiscus syriacus TaxID=106335 RepID=UPI001920477F|nr:phosphatidylinositol glycan anchor biosynthesis class U protein-like isoform X3 [Hibiscus syriacus]